MSDKAPPVPTGRYAPFEGMTYAIHRQVVGNF